MQIQHKPVLSLVRILWQLCKSCKSQASHWSGCCGNYANLGFSNASPNQTLLQGGGHISETIHHKPQILYFWNPLVQTSTFLHLDHHLIRMLEGVGLDTRIPKIYNTWGLWWIVSEIQFWGLGSPWGAWGPE